MKAGMVKSELRNMYNFHRRNESSRPWRNRYTPKWKSLYKDWALRLKDKELASKYYHSTHVSVSPRITQVAETQ